MSGRVRMLSLALVLGWAACLAAADKGTKAEGQTPPAGGSSVVAATVNGKEILADEVQEALAPTLAGRKVSPQSVMQAQAEVLAQIIDRRLVEKALSSGGKGVTEAQIDAAQARLETQLEAQKFTLKQYLEERQLTRAGLRKQIAWQLLWEPAMQQQLTDDVFEDYFDEHKKEFDGSEVRASHILFRPDKSADPAAINALIRVALALRAVGRWQVFVCRSGRYVFLGPQSRERRRLGLFSAARIDGRTVFSRGIFSADWRSQSTGCDSVWRPLDQGYRDQSRHQDVERRARGAQAAGRAALYDKIAKIAREKANIQFSGTWPHFKPGTRELVLPAKP